MNVKIEPLPPGKIETSIPGGLVSTTLSELGGALPGTFGPGGGRIPYTFNPPTMGTLKRIGELRARKDVNTPGKLAVAALVRALATLGSRDLAQGAEGAHAAEVAKLSIGDVLTLTFAWQLARAPEGVELKDQACARCGEAFETVRVDLGTLKVRALPELGEGAEPPAARVGLRRGFKLPDGSKVTTVLLRSPSWADVFWLLDEKGWANPALIQAFTLKGAIAGTDAEHDGIRPSVTMREIDQLWPEDVALIEEALAQIVASPDLRVECRCPSCGADNLIGLSWADPGFFGG